ncbi:MAG: hypothetical protein FD130_1818 [Halothiobacillaceae bacterium]|nr:MAG: hypothetical protein FD130_1818 [Halothiobacillaceae bacterium]
MRLTYLSATLAATMAGVAPAAFAIPGQMETPNGAAFSSACAGLNLGGVSVGNQISGSGANCQAQTSGVGGTANVAVNNSGVALGGTAYESTYSNAATGQATPLTIKLSANNDGNTNAPFPGAFVNGGWNDAITLSMAGQSGTGYWIAPIHVEGEFNTKNNGGSASLQLAAFLNHANIFGSASDLFRDVNLNPSAAQNYSYELARWGAANWGPLDAASLEHLSVDEIVHFVIPFTWDTSFDLGIFALASAGMRAQGATVGQPNATSDALFENTITWAGPGYVLNNGTGPQITGFNISSTSGANYAGKITAPVPEPAMLSLFGLGFAGLGFMYRKRATSV